MPDPAPELAPWPSASWWSHGHTPLAGGDLEAARARAAGGEAATLLRLRPGWARHRTRFAWGVWVQNGGVSGPSEPGAPAVFPPRRPPARRVLREAARLAPFRG